MAYNSFFSSEEQMAAAKLQQDSKLVNCLEPQDDVEKIVYIIWLAIQKNSVEVFDAAFSFISNHLLHINVADILIKSYAKGVGDVVDGAPEGYVPDNRTSSIQYTHSCYSTLTKATVKTLLGIDVSKVDCWEDLQEALKTKYIKAYSEKAKVEENTSKELFQKIISQDKQRSTDPDQYIRQLLLFLEGNEEHLGKCLQKYIEDEKCCKYFVDEIVPGYKKDIEIAIFFHLLQEFLHRTKDINLYLQDIRLSKQFVIDNPERFEEWRHIYGSDLKAIGECVGSHHQSNAFPADMLFCIYNLCYGVFWRVPYLVAYAGLYLNEIIPTLRHSIMTTFVDNNYYDLPGKIKEVTEKIEEFTIEDIADKDIELWPYLGLCRNGQFQRIIDIDNLNNRLTEGPLNKERLQKGGPLAIKILINYLGHYDYLKNTSDNLETFAYYVFGIGEKPKEDKKIEVGKANKARNNLVSVIKNLIGQDSSIDNISNGSSKGDKYTNFTKNINLKIDKPWQASDAYNQSKDFARLLENCFGIQSEAETEFEQEVRNRLEEISSNLKNLKTKKSTKAKNTKPKDSNSK